LLQRNTKLLHYDAAENHYVDRQDRFLINLNVLITKAVWAVVFYGKYRHDIFVGKYCCISDSE